MEQEKNNDTVQQKKHSSVALLLAILILAFFILIGFFYFLEYKDVLVGEVSKLENNEIVLTAAEKVVKRLPQEIVVGERTIILGTDSPSLTSRDQYYSDMDEKNGDTLMFEVPDLEMSRDPIHYIEMFIRNQLAQDFVSEHPSSFFNYSASFHLFGNALGVSSFVRMEDLPDEIINALEARFDFIIEEGEWRMDWYGWRVFCVEPDGGYWQPADTPCI